MSKIPTAKEFLESKYSPMKRDTNDLYDGVSLDDLIDFAKLHVAAALQSAKCFEVDGCGCGESTIIEEHINECYLLENIK